MRTLVDEPTHGVERYQDVVPGDFRYVTYVVEAAVQFRYLHEEYSRHDVVLFDRWLETYDCYCGHPTVHRQWYERLRAAVPKPDALFYLRIGPEAAVDRVASRGDWTADNWTREQLLADLHRRYDCYERAMSGSDAVVVDAERDGDEVLSTVLDHLGERLGLVAMRGAVR
jgi:thymidylate kinase